MAAARGGVEGGETRGDPRDPPRHSAHALLPREEPAARGARAKHRPRLRGRLQLRRCALRPHRRQRVGPNPLIQGDTMNWKQVLPLILVAPALALAQGKGPSDPQIAGIVVTANQTDIDAAKTAKSKRNNNEVKDFAQ